MKLTNCVVCDSMFSKFRGQMFRKSPERLVFKFNEDSWVPLHMWFVFFPIDVLFLDGSCRVVELKKNLRPFRFYNPKCKARYVVELPVESIGSVELGEEIIFF